MAVGSFWRGDRRGFSIFELMIAMTISLIVLVVMMQAFRRASGEIKKGRAMIELAAEMRAVGETFRRDLANLTVSPRVWNLSSESNGYFEIVEGPQNDATYADAPAVYPGMSFFGDVDDIIAMTVRSGEKPFRGRYDTDGDPSTPPTIVESHLAEVIWFVVIGDVDEIYAGNPPPPAPDPTIGLVDMDDRVTLHRRVLLIRPDLALTLDPSIPTPLDQIHEFFRQNDISARPVGGNMVANSLSDLTLRENRYAHDASTFPFEIQRSWLGDANPNFAASDRRVPTGEDIMLTNVAGFDIRVFSPNSIMKAPAGEQFLEPGDPRWGLNSATPVDEGAYVDLGWDWTGPATSWFAAPNSSPPASTPQRFSAGNTWCSWSPHYIYGTTAADGLDNNSNGLVDEEAEMIAVNAHAPYPWPIRAVQLTMRGIEKSTRNVRQVTIVSSFVPE